MQALEADRESMREAIVSMRTEKAQMVLLKEIAQHLSKEVVPERRLPIRKASIVGVFSFLSVFKVVIFNKNITHLLCSHHQLIFFFLNAVDHVICFLEKEGSSKQVSYTQSLMGPEF